MRTACFIVEGDSELELVKSNSFKNWLKEHCNIEVIGDPKDGNAGGNGNMCGIKMEKLALGVRKLHQPDLIIVLADLDPEDCAPCITERKNRIGNHGIDQILIARNSLEAWFLADSKAIENWTGIDQFHEDDPESFLRPWDQLKEIGSQSPSQRGPGKSKRVFAKNLIKKHGFTLKNAAKHENCHSAKYCYDKLLRLANG